MHTSYSSSCVRWLETAVLVDVGRDLSRNWPLRKAWRNTLQHLVNRKQGELGRDGYHGVSRTKNLLRVID